MNSYVIFISLVWGWREIKDSCVNLYDIYKSAAKGEFTLGHFSHGGNMTKSGPGQIATRHPLPTPTPAHPIFLDSTVGLLAVLSESSSKTGHP